MAALTDLTTAWASYYANHAAVRTAVEFAHLAALITAGGLAIATDRSLLLALGRGEWIRREQLEGLHDTHRIVVVGLAVITVSGLLLFGADAETFLYSRLFWLKMALLALLLVNGVWLTRTERSALDGGGRAWSRLRVSAIVSIALWLLTTLVGVGLGNIG